MLQIKNDKMDCFMSSCEDKKIFNIDYEFNVGSVKGTNQISILTHIDEYLKLTFIIRNGLSELIRMENFNDCITYCLKYIEDLKGSDRL